MKKQKFEFLMTLFIETEDGDIEVKEGGNVLEEFTLKKHFNEVVIALLGTKKKAVAGKTLSVDISVEKNGEYFDHDETLITVNQNADDFTIEEA